MLAMKAVAKWVVVMIVDCAEDIGGVGVGAAAAVDAAGVAADDDDGVSYDDVNDGVSRMHLEGDDVGCQSGAEKAMKSEVDVSTRLFSYHAPQSHREKGPRLKEAVGYGGGDGGAADGGGADDGEVDDGHDKAASILLDCYSWSQNSANVRLAWRANAIHHARIAVIRHDDNPHGVTLVTDSVSMSLLDLQRSRVDRVVASLGSVLKRVGG